MMDASLKLDDKDGNFNVGNDEDHVLLVETTSNANKENDVSNSRIEAIDVSNDEIVDVSKLLSCAHETETLEGDEADLHKHYSSCEKNPGHKEFIPIKKFSITHLPKDYQDTSVMEVLKNAADLTVRVEVRMTSTKRPEVHPNTTVPFAFYDLRGKSTLRLGTGKICLVYSYSEREKTKGKRGTCKCEKCIHSDTPSEEWYEIRVCTASHVVFDETEAQHTTCRFYYDAEDGPKITIGNWKLRSTDVSEDYALLESASCDDESMGKLEEIYIPWHRQWTNVNKKYASQRDHDKKSFIISHPHGCAKQLSIGRWTKRYDYGKDATSYARRTKYTYTTCTCPGSSGAHVLSLGYDDEMSEHVHSGIFEVGKNLNISGIGREFN